MYVIPKIADPVRHYFSEGRYWISAAGQGFLLIFGGVRQFVGIQKIC